MRLAGRTKSGRLDHDCEEAAFRQAFAAFDKDSSGTIDAHELKGLLKVMGIYADPLETEELLKQMDTDGNGVIDFEEFMAVMGGRQNEEELESELEELKSLFVMLDQDGNGQLCADELRRAMKIIGVQLSHDEAEWLLNDIDKDGNRHVSFEEFTEYVWNFDEKVPLKKDWNKNEQSSTPENENEDGASGSR